MGVNNLYLKRASVAGATAVLLGSLVTQPSAVASPAVATAACTMRFQSVTSGGDAAGTSVTATTPPTAKTVPGRHLFSPGSAKLASRWKYDGRTESWVVLGSTLYDAYYGSDEQSGEPFLYLNRVGGGWDKFTMLEQSAAADRSMRYGLRNDGVLFRWTNGWRTVSSYPGFASVKTMALISQTRTYDTFLATTRGGALYTIHIPVTATAKPVVKQVRPSTWQGFESLVAEKCGAQSTLLTAIDKDSGSAYLYAVSHANGAGTVIKSLGKVPGTFKDPVYARYADVDAAPLFGE